MSCHSATANHVRLVLHTAAFWLMHGVRAAIPAEQSARQLRVRDDKRAPDQDRRARDRASRPHRRSSADELPGGRAVPHRRPRPPAHRPRGRVPAEPPTWQINPERLAQRVSSYRSRRTDPSARVSSPDLQKSLVSCMIRVKYNYGVGLALSAKPYAVAKALVLTSTHLYLHRRMGGGKMAFSVLLSKRSLPGARFGC